MFVSIGCCFLGYDGTKIRIVVELSKFSVIFCMKEPCQSGYIVPLPCALFGFYCYFCGGKIQGMQSERYTDYATFLARHFTTKVQKLSVNAGFTCPNRDGRLGRGGCTYCNNASFTPGYCAGGEDVRQQLERGKAFFGKKYPEMKYLAYFQSYTNTYDTPERLAGFYEEALSVPDVVGLVVGTRPDCMPEAVLDRLAEMARRSFVLVEYGVETTDNATLRRINRGHTFECAAQAVERTAARGIPVGAHLILGLPGETREAMVERAGEMSRLPLDTLKLHQLQILRGTRMAVEFERSPEDFVSFTAESYAGTVVDFLERLRPDMAVERFTSQSPRDLLVWPDWGLKNYEFTALVKRELERRDTRQGRLWTAS